MNYYLKQKGVYSIGVPGEILGYFKAKEMFGNPMISMKRLMEPTIQLCTNGIKVSRSLSKAISLSQDMIKNNTVWRSVLVYVTRHQISSISNY